VFVVLAPSVIGVMLLESALRPPRRAFGVTGVLPEEVGIRAADGTALRAWYSPPARGSSGDAVIVLHGVGDNRLGVVSFASLFRRHGYAVLTPDSRGHGESGGLVTYGLRESDDVKRWAEWLEQRGARRLFGLGESMGAAILLQSLEAGAPLCAVVAESPFSTFREIAYDRMGQLFGLGTWFGRYPMRPVVEAALLYSRLRYGIALENVSPLDAVRATTAPVLLIHGPADRNIPVRHSRRIAAEKRAQVSLWEPSGAPHTRAYATHPAEFEKRVLALFGSCTDDTPRASGRIGAVPLAR